VPRKPKPTPIAVAMKIAEAERKPPTEEIIPLVFPEKLSTKRVTARNISNGIFQNELRAAVASQILPKLFQSLMNGVTAGDPVKMKQCWEVYQMLGGKNGLSINVNQNNVNQTANIESMRGKGVSSPDDMFRMLAEERESRLLTAGKPVVELVATPVEYDEGPEPEGE
jgi:hypothetical protein